MAGRRKRVAAANSDEVIIKKTKNTNNFKNSETPVSPKDSEQLHTLSIEQSNLNNSLMKLTDIVANLATSFGGFANSTISSNVSHEIIPVFDPEKKSETMEKWLQKLNETKTIYKWSDEITIMNMSTRLRGLAMIWYRNLPTKNFTWTEWQAKLNAAFPSENDFALMLEKMLARIKRKNETYMQYYYEKLAMINACDIYEKKAVSLIIKGIQIPTIQAASRAAMYENPEELLQFLQTCEEQPIQHTITTNPASRPIYRKPNSGFKDFRDMQLDKRVCYFCRKQGHISTYCPNKKSVKAPGDNERPKRVLRMEKSADETGKKYFKNILVNECELDAFIDLGATCNTIKNKVAYGINLQVDKIINTIKGYGGGLVKTLGVIRNIKVKIDTVTAYVNFYVVPDEVQKVDVIIGQQFSEQEHVAVFKDNDKLEFLDNSLNCLPNLQGDSEDNEDKIVLYLEKNSHIPPGHGVNAICVSGAKNKYLALTQSLRLQEGKEYYCPSCLVETDESGKCTIPIINLMNKDIVIKNNKKFARAENVKQRDLQILSIQNSSDDVLDNLRIGDITSFEKEKLLELLSKYRKSFSKYIKEIGCTNAVEFNIELNDDSPCTYKPYRMSPVERETLRTMIKELLDNNIIRESNSPYSSPVLLIKKKNGKPRLCIDYRKLNLKIKQVRFPLPRMDDQIDLLQGYKYFTSLDMTSGYYQIQIEEKSKYITAFITPDGQYEWNRLPFGISTAPRTFQYMINKILGDLRGKIGIAYLDDILVPSKSVKDGLQRLEIILQVLTKNNLTLNPEKCHFFEKQILFLGFEISEDGIRPGSEKIRSVAEFPVPKDQHNVRQFLGLTGFFRQFVQDYARIAAPLHKLTGKGKDFQWTNVEKEAFENLKSILTNRPILALYNPDLPTEVHTDASKVGLAGILLQQQNNGKLKPVAYYSRKTESSEEKWHSYELETLAIVESLRKFRVYLIDKTFKVVTDCEAIKSAAKKRDLVPKIARWWLEMQEFSFTIEHRAGSRMAHVDALSRNPIENQQPQELEQILRFEVADWVVAAQLCDEKLQTINEILDKTPNTKYEKDIHQDYIKKEDKIYRKVGDKLKWVVPKGMRYEIIKRNHDEFGHFGVEKTLQKICENYWFANMRQITEKYVKNCINCLQAKKPKGKQPGKLHPIEKVGIPFDTLHLDHLGPFIKTTAGKKYIIVCIESFTKYTLTFATSTTTTKPVLIFLDQIIKQFGAPKRIITDKGSCYTSKMFKSYCAQKGIKHIQNAVATPKANGQVERFNSTILNALIASVKNDTKWDKDLDNIQFSINNTIHSVTRKTPSQLLFGYTPKAPADAPLVNEIEQNNGLNEDLTSERAKVVRRVHTSQAKQKEYYDKRRCVGTIFQEGDLVVVLKPPVHKEGQSRKLVPKYRGPFKIKKVLQNDRFVVSAITSSCSKSAKLNDTVESIEHLKKWIPVVGFTDSESGEEEAERGRSSGQDARTVKEQMVRV